MKLTKQQLSQVIKEELSKVLKESEEWERMAADRVKDYRKQKDLPGTESTEERQAAEIERLNNIIYKHERTIRWLNDALDRLQTAILQDAGQHHPRLNPQGAGEQNETS